MGRELLEIKKVAKRMLYRLNFSILVRVKNASVPMGKMVLHSAAWVMQAAKEMEFH